MFADNFDDLVSKCVLSGFPHRMLYVFIRAAFSDDDGDAVGAVQILFDAHQPVQIGLTIDDVRATADGQNSNWNFVVVGIAKNSDATLPSEDQAKAFLADMREKVLVGDIGDFAFLDRDGEPVAVETDEVSDEEGVLH
ncbi:MAG: hypothetical protein HQ494_13000 [Rhodospirillales bacterium]|nr:hypothetical protein [Rhodospirillales bacterium]